MSPKTLNPFGGLRDQGLELLTQGDMAQPAQPKTKLLKGVYTGDCIGN